ncbi:MAG: calcium-binding protein [Chlorobium sp.]
MNINFNGTPVGNPNGYEIFLDFVFDTTKLSSTGYIATGILQNDSIDIFDINNDGIIDSFTDTWTDSAGVPWGTSGTMTWDTNGIVLAHATAGAFPNDNNHYGRLAYDAQGQVVGMNWLNINPVFTITPDTVAGDAVVASFQIAYPSGTPGNWTLLDNNLDGQIDHATQVFTWIGQNNVTQSETGNYSITWSDTTHFSAHALTKINCLTFDIQGRPTSFIDVTHPVPTPSPSSITWLDTKAPDNAVATTPDSRFYDTNGDNIPDKISYTTTHPDQTGIVRTGSGVMSIIGWMSLSPTNPFLELENQSSTFPGDVWTGTITGTNSNPTTITMPSYFMGNPGNTIITPSTNINAGGLTTITTPTMYSAGTSSDSTPLVTAPALANPTILNVTRPAGLTFIANDISGTAITDVRANLLASVGTTLAADTAIQSGIDTYLATIPTADQANVTVRTLTFSAPSSVSAGSLIVDGNAGHQEALVIDTTNLPAGSQIDLNNVDFAVIIGDNVTIRGGAGANLVYAGIGAQDIKLGVDDDTIHGGDGNDNIASTTGNDWLYGDAGNDTLTGGADDDHLDGGAGDDTAVFTGSFADYNISYNSGTDTYTIADRVVGRDGTDMVTGVEHFLFGTTTMAVADIYVPGNSSSDTETIVAGVAWVGLLAWLIL